MITLEVDEALIPNLSSFLPNDNPGASLGTMKALIPLCFLALSVVAKTTKAPAAIISFLKTINKIFKNVSGNSPNFNNTMGPIVYFFEGRSPSRHNKQKFCN